MAETPNAALERVDLPAARHGAPLVAGAPIVLLDHDEVRVDGERVADVSEIRRSGKLNRVDALFNALKAKRDAYVGAGKGFHGIALFGFDAKTPAVLVKSIFQTAAYAGFPNAEFAVRTQGSVARLDVDAYVPLPSAANAPASSDASKVVVVAHPPKLLVRWEEEGAVLATVEVATTNDLGIRVGRLRSTQRMGRPTPPDEPADLAVVHVDDAVDYGGIVAIVDALADVTRTDRGRSVPGFAVRLATGADPPAAPAAALPAKLEPLTIRVTVRKNFGEFRKCYEEGLSRNSSLAGTVPVKFVVQKDGTVANAAAEAHSTLRDEAVVGCIVAAFDKLTFPPPANGVVSIVYPIQFSPSD